jgi:hypothetical protein
MSSAADGPVAAAALYAAACFRRGTLVRSDLRQVIEAMMYQDIWYDEFLYVLDPRARWPDEALPAIEKALEHFGLPMPEVDEANRILVEHLLRPIAEERIDPVDGLNEFMRRFFWEYEEPDWVKTVGQSIGVERLVRLYYQLDDWLDFKPNFLSDPADAHEVSKLKAEIVRAAQERLENRGAEVRD